MLLSFCLTLRHVTTLFEICLLLVLVVRRRRRYKKGGGDEMKKYLKLEKFFSSLLLCMGRSESSEKYIYIFSQLRLLLELVGGAYYDFCLPVCEFGKHFKIPQSIAGSVPDFSFFSFPFSFLMRFSLFFLSFFFSLLPLFFLSFFLSFLLSSNSDHHD